MKELLRRLLAHPLLALELGLASLFANLLALASPLFVTQVLNRYVASGVDATLITMTIGVIIAIALEFGFRQARLRLALSVSDKRNQTLTTGTMGVLLTARADPLHSSWSMTHRREIIRSLTTIRQAYSAPNLVVAMDLPFSLLYIVVLTLLSPPLGLIALLFLSLLWAFNLTNTRLTRKPLQHLHELQLQQDALTLTACGRIDTIRTYGGSPWIQHRWQKLHETNESLNQHLEIRQGFAQGMQGTIQSLLSVAIIAVGAKLALAGEMEVGTLIGANILAARSLTPILRWGPLNDLLIRAEQALTRLEQFAKLPLERESGAILKSYQGGLELKDLAKTLPPAPMPIFESLNLTLPPGAVLAVSGEDGRGKTMLARMLAGLVAPDRGQILVDGVDLAQLNPFWWRQQIIFLPQDPDFLDGTARENITLANPNLSPEDLNAAITTAGLAPWLDESPTGLDAPLIDGGQNLSPDLRKRLALARALINRGKLAILDEPTENLTPKGVLTLYTVLHTLSLQGTTLVVFTNDPNILRGASLVLDLNSKPKPTLINRLTRSTPT
ncbi:MAG: ATP-binding cassette domain-containing protein [Magnetococcales bacterium]|nr:ATP-binding cassette domain-containing protein [Magnetococcales bacterium]